jgi:hypothetical protein
VKKGDGKKLNQAGEGNWKSVENVKLARSQPFIVGASLSGRGVSSQKGGRFRMRRHLKANYMGILTSKIPKRQYALSSIRVVSRPAAQDIRLARTIEDNGFDPFRIHWSILVISSSRSNFVPLKFHPLSKNMRFGGAISSWRVQPCTGYLQSRAFIPLCAENQNPSTAAALHLWYFRRQRLLQHEAHQRENAQARAIQ